MPAVQTAFPLRQDAYVVGSPAMSRYDSDTGVVETAAGIAVGMPVQRGTDPRGVAIFSGGTLLGIARLNRGGTSDRHPQYKPLAYIERGHMPVIADAAVAVDAQVRWNSATGRYTSAAASGTVFELPGWTFDTPAAAAGGLVIIKRV